MDKFWFKRKEAQEDARRERKCCIGNFFNPGSTSFLGGPIGQTLAEVDLVEEQGDGLGGGQAQTLQYFFGFAL